MMGWMAPLRHRRAKLVFSKNHQEREPSMSEITTIGLVQQQTQRVYENMALLPLDLFARVIAMRIDAGPPFSALFTLWLSTMAAVGLASRSPCSRHAT